MAITCLFFNEIQPGSGVTNFCQGWRGFLCPQLTVFSLITKVARIDDVVVTIGVTPPG